jgi:hypothetical protein
MAGSSPDPRYYKDGYGFRPRWRLFFLSPRTYLRLMLPMPLKMIRIRWNDRRRPR